MKNYWFGLVLVVGVSCMKGKQVDLIVHNAKIHCMDDQNTVEDAMAIKDGKIVEVGPERQILNKYRADEIQDAEQRDVYPGFTDAHTHMFSLAKQNLGVDLTDCKSMDEVVDRIKTYLKKKKHSFVIGRGWDQTRWKDDRMPTKESISKTFPNIPVALYRIDGHALLVNEALLTIIRPYKTLILDGPFETGLFIDNDMSIPEAKMLDFSEKEYVEELLKIQEKLYAYGVTGVHEAGVLNWQIKLLKRLVQEDRLSLNMYAMLSANEENYQFAKRNGVISLKNLSVRSFKLYIDGALGSRGALLKAPYADQHGHIGMQLISEEDLSLWIERCLALNYQLNTHAIGDKGNQLVLNGYKRAFEQNPDHRWRIEHAQVVNQADFKIFAENNIIPSVQSTHATSDMYWAADRLGSERVKGAYAFKQLLDQNGWIVLGTDFPVENINPMYTFYAAVVRKDMKGYPESGYQMENAISREQALRGMTIWAARGQFEENEKGSIEAGKVADFLILDQDIMKADAGQLFKTRVLKTYLNGENVYSK